MKKNVVVLAEAASDIERGIDFYRLACRRGALRIAPLHEDAFIPVLDLLDKYADIPMSIADACLVRLTEVLPDPLLLTTDSDFKIYRRLGRRVIPTRMP